MPIFKWDAGEQLVGPGFHIYLKTALPMTIVTLLLLFAWIWLSNTAAKHDIGTHTQLVREFLKIGRFLGTCLCILFCCRLFREHEETQTRALPPPASPNVAREKVTNGQNVLTAQQVASVTPRSATNKSSSTNSTQSNQKSAANHSQASNTTSTATVSNGTQSSPIAQNLLASQLAVSQTQAPITPASQVAPTPTSSPASAQTSNLPAQPTGAQVYKPATTHWPAKKEAQQTSIENSSQKSGRPASTVRSRPRFIQNLLHFGGAKTKNSNPC